MLRRITDTFLGHGTPLQFDGQIQQPVANTFGGHRVIAITGWCIRKLGRFDW